MTTSATSNAARREAQAGLTLVELMVTTLLLGIIGTIVISTFLTGSRTLGRVDDDVQGQGDQRVVSEWILRDLREARGVEPPSAADLSADPNVAKRKLSIWIDYNANYKRETGEVVTWLLSTTTSADGHYNVMRTVNDGTSQVVARALVSGIAFAYKNDKNPSLTGTAVSTASVVVVTMEYDAIVGAFLQKKYTTFDARMRNVV
jgi:prepilin-type N-terminal cleavage/methylation domain-containing protein